MNILIYARSWNVDQFHLIAKNVDKNAIITISSEHEAVDQSGLVKEYFSLIHSKKFIAPVNGPTPLDNDMIQRCRLLRNIDIETALKHLYAMRQAVSKVFDEFSPNIILSITIDSFVIDSIYQEALIRNIQFIGLIPSFINGYTRITARGEHNNIRCPEQKEIDTVSQRLLEKNYAPAFNLKSRKSPVKSCAMRCIMHPIRYFFFFMKRLSIRNRYNYHYWQSQIISKQLMHFIPRVWLGNKDWKKNIDNERLKLFIPLQMIPEATVDYWCDQLEYTDYEATLLSFIKKFEGKFQFLIKEHPNVLGYRNPSLYRKLESLANVTIIPTYENSNEIIAMSDLICVWTGTVGIESMIRGKPIISFCLPYFSEKESIKTITEQTTYEDIFSYVESFVPKDTKSIICRVLSGVVGVKFINDGSWEAHNEAHRADAEKLGELIKDYIILD